MTTRPNFVTDDHLEYLDALRASGVTNMFGAAAYLVNSFTIDNETARKILVYWMESFGNKRDR